MTEEDKKLIETHPFLEGWWEIWDDSGWEKIWKIFLRKVCKEYEQWDYDKKHEFSIFDSKEKFGALRVTTCGGTLKINELENILEMMSEWTCIKCGSMPRDEKDGKRVIWQSQGWICPYCEKCSKEITDSAVKKKKEGFFEYHLWTNNGEKSMIYRDIGDWLEMMNKGRR